MLLRSEETTMLIIDFQPHYMRQRKLAPYFNTQSFVRDVLPAAVTQIWVAHDVKNRGRDKTGIIPFRDQQNDIFGKTVPTPDTLTMVKPSYSAFFGTPLLDWLDAHEMRNVLVAGLYGEACVGLTAHDAADYEFNTILLSDMIQMHDPVSVETLSSHKTPLMHSKDLRFF
ncbi:MAG: isochorismatase family protein [Pseudobdellovibrionaceae bacterium]